MNFRPTMLLVLLVMLGCRGWESELVRSKDFESQLNVLAILSPDDGGVVEVQVMRTLPLEGPTGERSDPFTECHYSEYYDSTICHERTRWISYYSVTDALVTLSDGGATYDFRYDDRVDRYQYTGYYVPVDTNFFPVTGVTYQLSVETPDGLEVSGTCTIPPPVAIKTDLLSDTLQVRKTFDVAWTHTANYVQVLIRSVPDTGYAWHACEVWKHAIVQDDSSWTFRIVPDCWEEADTLIPYFEVEISVLAMDKRYYDYFISPEGGANETTFIFLGMGDTGRSQGIEGGLGVFAAYRSDTVRRLVKR